MSGFSRTVMHMHTRKRLEALTLVAATAAILSITAALRLWLHLANPTIASLSYLLVVLLAATASTLRVAIAVSVAADLFLNYFFLPPLGTFVVADPENWVALFAFLAVSVIASDLSAAARARARDALARRDELAQLLDERKAAELARQGAEFKSALLASLAHDLRTPLTAIRVAAGNLQASWLPDGDRREQSEVILTEVARLNRLFQNILEMARIDAGAVAAEARWVHPSEIVEAALDQVERRGRPFDVAIESDVLVNLDPRLTAAALAQLLQNAAQYTPPGSPITVTVTVSADGLVATVRDRGPGIAPRDLPHLFDRFYRGREGGQRASGTGMGLSIARGMLVAERGRIWAENCPDGGAQFTIAVPAERQPSAPADQRA
jgi:K+-sensing histidine kinase KdpD